MGDFFHRVAVIGAGPAGLFAARYLNGHGVTVALFNRDIKPGGLAEYGVFLDKIKMKEGLRKQFDQILMSDSLDYFGNVKVSSGGNLLLSDLFDAGFQAILVATGAQGTKWLRLPGEQLPGVYHSKDVVFYYNRLPPFSERRLILGSRVILVGAGNVMMDLAHYLIRIKQVKEVTVVMRRGPGEVKFTRKELENVAANINFTKLDAEIERVAPIMRSVGQDVDSARQIFASAIPKSLPAVSSTELRFEFLASPVHILGDWTKGVNALKVEDNTLSVVDGIVKAKGLGSTRQIATDSLIFAIGDTVDKDFSLPIYGDEYCINENPQFPVDGISYEPYDVENSQPVKAVFLAGWARKASTGLVGVARKDGENSAQAVLEYLKTQPELPEVDQQYDEFKKWVMSNFHQVVTKKELAILRIAELEEIKNREIDDFRYTTNEEMLNAINYYGNFKGDLIPR